MQVNSRHGIAPSTHPQAQEKPPVPPTTGKVSKLIKHFGESSTPAKKAPSDVKPKPKDQNSFKAQQPSNKAPEPSAKAQQPSSKAPGPSSKAQQPSAKASATNGQEQFRKPDDSMHDSKDAVEDPDLPNNIMAIVTPEKEKLQKTYVKEDAILLLGKTCAGKSMLGNLLCGVKLIGNKDRTFNAINPLFEYSHSNTESCTACPTVHSPKDQNFSCIDFPGFDDTRGAAQDIANAFFREAILANTHNFKIVLAINYYDLAFRGPGVRDTIHEMLQFLGIQGAAKLTNLAKATVLVVTHVPPEADHAKIVKNLENYTEPKDTLSKAGKSLLAYILREKQWFTFSAPSKAGENANTTYEGIKIAALIHTKAAYLSKSDTQLQVKANPRHGSKIQSTLQHYIGNLKLKFAERLMKALEKRLGKFYMGADGENAIKEFQRKFHQVVASKEPRTLVALFKELEFGMGEFYSNVLPEAEVQAADDTMKFLWNLLPREAHSVAIRRDWLEEFGLREILMSWNQLLVRMTSDIQPFPTGNTVTLQGYFPKTSQMLNYIRGRTGVQEVRIYALHTVYVDESLEGPEFKGVKVIIIAPNWNVRNTNRIIDLTGENCTHRHEGQANPGVEFGAPGADGQPGREGLNGGHFFGLGSIFSGLDGLTVRANGGQGGQGQMGGNGQVGISRGDARVKDDFVDGKSGWDKAKKKKNNHGWDYVEWPTNDDQSDVHLINYGQPGGVGGNGGRGGAGGNGGLPGTIELIALENSQNTLKTSAQNGSEGVAGDAGSGAKGGRNGRNFRGIWHIKNGSSEWNKHYERRHDPKPEVPDTFANDGSRPTEKNSTNRNPPAPQAAFNALNPLYGYREFAIRENNFMTIEALEAFRKMYDGHVDIQKKTTADQLIEECQKMEEFYMQLPDKSKCLPLYQWMLERIQTYSQQQNAGDIALVQCLYTYTLSRICQIKAAMESRLIIDIKEFLRIVQANLVTLDRLDHNVMVRMYEQAYVQEINDKIAESDIYLKKLRDDIRSADRKLVEQIDILVKEIEQLKEKNDHKIDELKAKRDELKALIDKRRLLGGLTMAIQCIGCCFPPAGPIVAGAVSSGISAIANPSGTVELGGQALSTYTETLSKVIEGGESGKVRLSDAHTQVLSRIRATTLINATMDATGMSSKSEEEQVKAMDQAITQIEEQQQLLDKYKEKVNKTFADHLHQLVDGADTLQQALKGQSRMALDFSRLGVRRSFYNAIEEIRKMTKNFAAGDGFLTILQEMEEAIEVSANIYGLVEEYRERRGLVQYMARLASTSANDPRIEIYKQKVQRNVVLEQYGRAVAAVRQWAFPFASLFLEPFTDLQDFLKAGTTEDFMRSVRDKLAHLKNVVDRNSPEINSIIDEVLWDGDFSGSSEKGNGPFYIWNYAEHGQEIRDLLRGKEVSLFADVTKTKAIFSAIKFTKIELQIQTDDLILQQQLDNALEGVRVELRHSGVSFYRHDRIYRMNNDRGFCLRYQISKPGKPMQATNKVFAKMGNGDFILSPYTKWTVQLIKEGKKLSDLFSNALNMFKLALVGRGQYVLTEKAQGNPWDLGQYSGNMELGAGSSSGTAGGGTPNPGMGSAGSSGAGNTGVKNPGPGPSEKPKPSVSSLSENAFTNQKNGYLYQATDFDNMLYARELRQEFENFTVLGGAQHDDISAKLQEILEIVDTGKAVLCPYNLSNVHWVAFCMFRHENQLMVLYKDSLGSEINGLYKALEKMNVVFRVHKGSEQAGDGTHCGIMALENLRIMARALNSLNREQFIQNFKDQTFCTLETARDLRKGDFPRFYREGDLAREQQVAERRRRADISDRAHDQDVTAICEKLRPVLAEAGIAVQNEPTEVDATKIVVVQICSEDSDVTDYCYRIKGTNDISVETVQSYLAKCFNWHETTDYTIHVKMIKVHTKIK